MRKIILLAVFAFSIFGFSQSTGGKNTDLWIQYRFDFKKFNSSINVRSANTILISKNQGSLFTFEKMMNLGSIQKSRAIEASEALLYRTPYFFLISRTGNSIYHYETIGNELFKFQESSNLDWKLVNEEKLIGKYKCKKAILNYLGRDWVAWYTTQIPANIGPYKFHGLPGLILNIKDSEDTFEFSANEIKTGNFNTDSKIKNYFIAEKGEEFQQIENNEFYEIRQKFYEMTLNERLQYMNRENEGTHRLIISGANGEKPRVNRKSKARNFIELYRKK